MRATSEIGCARSWRGWGGDGGVGGRSGIVNDPLQRDVVEAKPDEDLTGSLLWMRLPETVSRSERRDHPVLRETLRGYRAVLGHPRAMAYAVCISFAAGATLVYLTSAASIYMEWFGVGPTPFGLLLALSTVAVIIGTALW